MWKKPPTKGQIKERIDAFLRAFAAANFDAAFDLCPPVVYEDDGDDDEDDEDDRDDDDVDDDDDAGMEVRSDLKGAELGEFLSHAMFDAIEGQAVVKSAKKKFVATDPKTWCATITPPADVDYEDFGLVFPSEDEEDEDEDDDDDDDDDQDDDDVSDTTVATGPGEVHANVHLKGKGTDIRGRYALLETDNGWMLAFANFDVM